MERTNQFDLQKSVNHFIEKINVNELLSAQEIAELKDHFLSQTEDLESAGLSSEEAFAVSKMRFGAPEMVQEEYEKSKPFEKWKRYLMIGILFYLLVGNIYFTLDILITGLVVLFSNSIIIGFPLIKYFYILFILSGFSLAFRWIFILIKNGKITDYKKYVSLIPFSFIILYPIQLYIFRLSVSKFNSLELMNLMLGLRISFIIFMIAIVLLTFWGIKKQWLYKIIKV